jgi:hypothetical protein
MDGRDEGKPFAREKISKPKGKILVRLATGWTPRRIDITSIVDLEWDDYGWGDNILLVDTEQGRLKIKLDISDMSSDQLNRIIWWGPKSPPEEAKDISGSARLRNECILYFSNGVIGDSQFNLGRDGGATVTVSFPEWSVEGEGKSELWISPLQLSRKLPFATGNLSTRADFGDQGYHITGNHLRLSGRYTYYIIRTPEKFGGGQERYWLALDVGGDEVPDSEIFGVELMGLEYVLGGRLRFEQFIGVTDSLESNAMSSATSGSEKNASGLAKPPIEYQSQEVWIAPFFQKLSARLEPGGRSPLNVAVNQYLYSTADSIDVQNMSLHVASAIRTLIRQYVSTRDLQEEATPVHDPHEWREWVDEIANRLSDVSRDPSEMKERLLELGQPRMIDLLRVAVSDAGFDVSSEITNFITNAHNLLEQIEPGHFPGESAIRKELEKDIERQATLRNLFGAFLGAYIDYGGKVNEYTDFSSQQYSRQQPSEKDEDRAYALKFYHAEANVPSLAAIDWPQYDPPSIPDNHLVQYLQDFARKLQAKTNGKVAARLQPLPSTEDDHPTLDFKLYVRVHPSTQTTVFSVDIVGGDMNVYGWVENIDTICTIEELQNFIIQIRDSQDLRQRIERMLLLHERYVDSRL